jgi:hypothetical protein
METLIIELEECSMTKITFMKIYKIIKILKKIEE